MHQMAPKSARNRPLRHTFDRLGGFIDFVWFVKLLGLRLRLHSIEFCQFLALDPRIVERCLRLNVAVKIQTKCRSFRTNRKRNEKF